MKFLTLISLAVLTFLIVTTPRAHALFGHVTAEKERRQQAENRVLQAQQVNNQLHDKNERLYLVVSVLSAGVTVALVIGAAVGSKTRRDA